MGNFNSGKPSKPVYVYDLTYKNLIFSFSPLDSQLDRDIVLYLGTDKHNKRLEQVNKAVYKYYNKDIEAGRARARKYYENRKAKKNGTTNA